MATFETLISRIDKVEHHPNADRLSLNYIRGNIVISNKFKDGSHRYNIGDLVVYVTSGSIVPENLLKLGFWDSTKNKGTLSGSNGDRVTPVKLRGIVSDGIIFPVSILPNNLIILNNDVSEYLNITKYEPKLPEHMNGDIFYIGNHNTISYDVENFDKFKDKFSSDMLVVVTEKLHRI